MENFIKKYNVSRETLSDFQTCVKLLTEWQAKFNLVSTNSLSEVWSRHIADSAQLYQYLEMEKGNVYDLGSGAGFPALVLAIMSRRQKPGLRFKLIESITKKTVYLNAVKQALGLDNVEVINARIEGLNLPPADYITARALTALPKLLTYALPLSSRSTKLIFPKGKNYEQELTEAKKDWNFKLNIQPNSESADGVVLLFENLRRKSK